jgi:hypothetical protein
VVSGLSEWGEDEGGDGRRETIREMSRLYGMWSRFAGDTRRDGLAIRGTGNLLGLGIVADDGSPKRATNGTDETP